MKAVLSSLGTIASKVLNKESVNLPLTKTGDLVVSADSSAGFLGYSCNLNGEELNLQFTDLRKYYITYMRLEPLFYVDHLGGVSIKLKLVGVKVAERKLYTGPDQAVPQTEKKRFRLVE